MKKTDVRKLGIIFLVASLLMTGCTGDESSISSNKGLPQARESSAGDGFDYKSDDVADTAVEEEAAGDSTKDAASDTKNGENNSVGNKQNTTNQINKEKLVYRCNMAIDTLEYKDSVKKFRDLIKKYEGFVENENESDDGSMEGYYYYGDVNPTKKKHSTYQATVRIPSAKYDDFLEETGGIGEVRTKNANVENVSQSYYNLQAELEVMEAKYQRYLEMLKKATTTKDIITIESTITDIEVQINQIKTQLNRYDNDVAYSYVSVTIKEVEKIVPEEDKGTVSNDFEQSWEAFGNVCHSLFIIFLYFLPYLLVIIVILLIVFFATMPARRKHKAKKKLAQANMQAPPVNPQAQGNEAEKK